MSSTNPTQDEHDVVTKQSPRSVAETVARLTEILSTRGIKLFAVIDQRAEAHQVGLELRETTLVIFGSPIQGTPVMVAAPLAALDLPLKVVVWADDAQTKVSYLAPRALAARYQLSADLARNLAGIDALTDALVTPS
jgi:uncharacterized protein (DUF302 family)